MGKSQDLDAAKVRELAERALRNGGTQVGLRSILWDLGQRCESPVWIEAGARPAIDPYTGKRHQAIWVDMWVPCRRCRACLRKRSKRWARGAVSEIRASQRTWFGTLTLRPEEHYRALLRGKVGGSDLQRRHQGVSPELTRYLKRVRKESGARFRYLLVMEAHKSGLPHYHMLLHEWEGQVRWSTLSEQWVLGFSRWKLVKEGPETPTDARSAWYIAKYLAKSVEARVRASQRYGSLFNDPVVL